MIINSLFPQTVDVDSKDYIYLSNGQFHTGEYISSDEEFIIFKPEGSNVGQRVKKSIIREVILADGTIIFKTDDKSIRNNRLGLGMQIDNNPIFSIPFNWKTFLFEPMLGIEWSRNDSSSTNNIDLSMSLYHNFPSINNFNIILGASSGLSINNFSGQEYHTNAQKLFFSFKLGCQYKLLENFFISYETAFQTNRNNGGYIELSGLKQEFDNNDESSEIISTFIIRYYFK